MSRSGIYTRSPRTIALCALSLHAAAGCATSDESLTEIVSQPLTSGAKRAANGAACTAGQDETAVENDCLTVETAWNAVGARPANHNNAGGKRVYTGIDSMADAGLIATEKTFAEGFRTAAGKAQGGVYGAHGNPGWIQGLPDNAAAGGAGTILHEAFGGANIPWLGLSVCWAGNSGADADSDSLADTPPVYVNNIAPASFVSTYFGIASAAIVACKNGTVGPDDDVLWCKQRKQQRAGWTKPKLLGNGMLVEGNGAMRGAAVTKNNANDATGDFTVTLQAEGPDADMDGQPDWPARSFKVRNLPKNRMRRDRNTGALPYPWSLDDRCAPCAGGICTPQDNYPRFQSASVCLASPPPPPPPPPPAPEPTPTPAPEPTPVPAPDSYPLPALASIATSPGICSLMDFTLNGQFLTTNIQIEQPDGSLVSAMGVTASPDGLFAHFQFAPTQIGTHYIWVTDEDDLNNDPKDPDFVMYESFVVGSPTPDPIPVLR